MENLVDKVISLDLNEIDTYNFPMEKAFGLKINHDGAEFCFIIKFRQNSKNLICCASGAQKRNGKNSRGKLKYPPYFDRWSWYRYFDESFIAYADPIFLQDEKIRLGWYVGVKNHWYLETISLIIKTLAANQKICLDDILCFGSSGGGFASICLATLLKGSKVIVNNSQFNIMNYYESFVNDLFGILEKDFPDSSQSQIYDELKYRLNTIELFKKYNYMPPISYYINILSGSDLERHCLPFINDVKELPFFNNELNIFFYKEEKASPHGPLATQKTISILKSFFKQSI